MINCYVFGAYIDNTIITTNHFCRLSSVWTKTVISVFP